MKTVAYIRVSTTRQTEGNGPEQQKRNIVIFAQYTGTKIDEWVLDDESGTTEDREGIQALLARDDVETIIYDRQDRLGRTLLVAESLYAKFRAKRVQMVCVAQRFDDSPMGRAMRQMAGVFAELQRSEMLLRLGQCKVAAKAKRGTFGGGTVPYGFRSVGNGKLVADIATVDLVNRCHALRKEGLTYEAIAERLQSEGFRSRKGTPILKGQVHRICSMGEAQRAATNFGHVPLDPGVAPAHPAILLEDN